MQLGRNSTNMSSFLGKMREYRALSSKATFWFGGILSLIEDNSHININDDLSTEEKTEMLKIISSAVGAIASFYEQERPNSVYKLLNFAQNLLQGMQASREFAVVLGRVTYLNSLSLYAIKTRQYAYALNIFSEILQIFQSKVVDNANQPFLVFLSNYLSFLQKSSKKMTSRLIEVETLLRDTFLKFFTKVMVGQSGSDTSIASLPLLTALFKQNYALLSKYEKDLNSMLLHYYQQQMKAKRKIPENMIEYIFKESVFKQLYFSILFSEDEIKFYSAHKPKQAQSVALRRHLQTPQQEEPDRKLSKIEAMLQQSIEMLSEQKLTSARYATLQRNQTFRLNQLKEPQGKTNKSTLDPEPKNLQTLQPLPRTLTKKREVLPVVTRAGKVGKVVRFKAITFKIRSIFIEINEDGILLSDYTKQNKRYIQWNTLSLILERLEQHFPLQQLLKVPVENYYDFVRILSFYLTKDDSKEICLVPRPLPLLEVNQLIRLYKQEGKYLKLALMHHYDTDKFVGVIDCCLSEFSEFFKSLNDNEYLLLLNQRVKGAVGDREEGTYLLDYIKRKRETTVAELSNQLQAEQLECALEEKNTLYKCLFLLKNNLQLLVRIVDNIKQGMGFEDYALQIRIDTLSSLSNETFYLSSQKDPNEKKISKVMEIPIERLTYYLPSYGLPLRDYLILYSRPVIDMLNSFDLYSNEVNLGGLSFEMQVHASRTDTIEYGKYVSLVSAELVGSRERVWAMVVRFYDLAYVAERVTVLMNPYFQFLQGLIGASADQKTQVIKRLLVGQNVRETYLWLKRNNKLQRRINLFEYLYANQLI